MSTIKVNFNENTIGKIRPLHGVNSGPMSKVFTYDMRPQFCEAGFPYARLHDVEYPYGSGEFVDVHCIFKNFDADENLPENYHFELTDKYLEAVFEVGCLPLFRLGESIEHAPVKRYVFPPKDYLKWAKICEHIIRHYTDGWANGYHWPIEYWEIWNEADNCYSGGTNMWNGTPLEFYEFYDVTATYLKSAFPHLKIGGGAFCRGVGPFQEGFLQYISTRDHKVPLDFYSWHRYFAQIDSKMVSEATKTRTMLNRYGFSETESVFDEWNYMEDWTNQAQSYVLLKNHVGAAFCAGVLCALQSQTDVSIATYFEADIVKEWCGIFAVDKMGIGKVRATVKPLKPFYAFKCFNELYKLGEAVAAASDMPETLKCCAARGQDQCALMVANYGGGDETVEISLQGICGNIIEVRMTDEAHTFDVVQTHRVQDGSLTVRLPMAKNSFAYIDSRL